MKQTFKKPSYYLLSQAMDGDEKAIEKILAFYDPYINANIRMYRNDHLKMYKITL